jgi:phosphatidylinositol kinase/protein kinase (PI-3  family)
MKQSTKSSLNPQQTLFLSLYNKSTSTTFGNCYQSAIASGYSKQTARNLTHVRPKWLSEFYGKSTHNPNDLLDKLTSIIDEANEPTRNKLKAIEMLMRYYKMFNDNSSNNTINVSLDLGGVRLGTHYVAAEGVATSINQ